MTRGILSAADCGAILSVSRETLDRLSAYVSLLEKWNRRINLVGRQTLLDVWRRHVLDSGQLIRYAPAEGPWIDLGSGAGLPGQILAILSAKPVHLVESDSRKCAFLREAARVTGTDTTIHNDRIEALGPELRDLKPTLITARALAPLDRLLELIAPLAGPDLSILLLKGRDVEVELTDASKSWNMRPTLHPSLSDPDGRVLKLERLSRVKRD